MVGYKNVTLASTIGYDTLIIVYEICTYFGGICALVNILLLSIFFTYRLFRRKYHLLITLAIADLISCLSILWLGIERQIEYRNVLATLTTPVRTTLNCAITTSAWMQVIGDVWPPMVQLLLAAERVLAVHFPIWYRSHMHHDSRYVQAIGSFIFVLVLLLIGFVISYALNDSGLVKFECGRKAAFSSAYGIVIYFYIVIGYSTAFSGNLAAYVGARRQAHASAEMAKQVRRIRSLLGISFLSVVLITIPNVVNLAQVYIPSLQISDPVDQAVNCITCINCAIDIFIYLKFNNEFRSRVMQLLRIKQTKNSNQVSMMPTTMARSDCIGMFQKFRSNMKFQFFI